MNYDASFDGKHMQTSFDKHCELVNHKSSENKIKV